MFNETIFQTNWSLQPKIFDELISQIKFDK